MFEASGRVQFVCLKRNPAEHFFRRVRIANGVENVVSTRDEEGRRQQRACEVEAGTNVRPPSRCTLDELLRNR